MLDKIVHFFTKYYPVLVILSAVQAYLNPTPYESLGWTLSWWLGLIMLSMGLTMTPNDFKMIFTHPKDVLIGVFLLYICMPFVGLGLGHLFGFAPMMIVGFILLGCLPAGTSTNVMTFLSKGDTVLSVTVSSTSIVIAPVLMPLLLLFFAGAYLEINVVGMFISIVQIIIIPIVLGLSIRHFFTRALPFLLRVVPLTSTLSIVAIVAVVTAMNIELLREAAGLVIVACIVYIGCGLLVGYLGARLFRMSMEKRKALTFLNGIQNTALGVAVAVQYFDPMAAIPSAIVCVMTAVFCPVVAGIWLRRTES